MLTAVCSLAGTTSYTPRRQYVDLACASAQQAKSCLRKKKKLEQIRDQKEKSLENLQQIMSAIQQADSNKMVRAADDSNMGCSCCTCYFTSRLLSGRKYHTMLYTHVSELELQISTCLHEAKNLILTGQ